MGIGFLMIIPVIFWLFIVMLIIAVARPKRRSGQKDRGGYSTQRYSTSASGRFSSRTDTKTVFKRPEMQKGLFDIKLGKNKTGKTKMNIFGNTGFDDYSVIGRKKDYVTGYDKKYSRDSLRARRSVAKQYSHTYDGHEPWDKCMPKEKDPWDKDFYS